MAPYTEYPGRGRLELVNAPMHTDANTDVSQSPCSANGPEDSLRLVSCGPFVSSHGRIHTDANTDVCQH